MELLIERFLKECNYDHSSTLEVILIDYNSYNINFFSDLNFEKNIKEYLDYLTYTPHKKILLQEGDKEYLLARFKNVNFSTAIEVLFEEGNFEYFKKVEEFIGQNRESQQEVVGLLYQI